MVVGLIRPAAIRPPLSNIVHARIEQSRRERVCWITHID